MSAAPRTAKSTCPKDVTTDGLATPSSRRSKSSARSSEEEASPTLARALPGKSDRISLRGGRGVPQCGFPEHASGMCQQPPGKPLGHPRRRLCRRFRYKRHSGLWKPVVPIVVKRRLRSIYTLLVRITRLGLGKGSASEAHGSGSLRCLVPDCRVPSWERGTALCLWQGRENFQEPVRLRVETGGQCVLGAFKFRRGVSRRSRIGLVGFV